jgi:hypothetical protein
MKLSAAQPPAHDDPLLVLPIYMPSIPKEKGETRNISASGQMFPWSINLNGGNASTVRSTIT